MCFYVILVWLFCEKSFYSSSDSRKVFLQEEELDLKFILAISKHVKT